jgi:sodium/hydrogen antiporter
VVLVAVFGVALLVAVLLSGLAARTVLSTSFLFLVGGALVSDGFLGLIHITPDSEIVSVTADLALFAVLFTDGQHVSFAKLRTNWRNPARALGLGMPLAFVFMALVTHFLVGSTGRRRSWWARCWHRPTRCSPPRSWAARRSPPSCASC